MITHSGKSERERSSAVARRQDPSGHLQRRLESQQGHAPGECGRQLEPYSCTSRKKASDVRFDELREGEPPRSLGGDENKRSAIARRGVLRLVHRDNSRCQSVAASSLGEQNQ